MVAFVTATPNPVVFTWPDVLQKRLRDVEVVWDTGDKRPGRVIISVDGVARPPVPPAGAAAGSTRFQIGLAQTATAELKSADGKVSYGLTTITTTKDGLAERLTDPDRTFIQHLRVNVGIDSLVVTFSTRDVAVGSLMVRRKDSGAAVAAPMEPHFGQQHRLTVSNLAQDTAFELSIIALRRNAQGGVTLGSGAKNPTRRATATTGSRTVTVFFDSIWLRNDSDGGGTGETHFSMGAGGVFQPGHFGEVFFDDNDFGDGQTRAVDRSVVGMHAPRSVWLQAAGYDDDGGLFTGLGVRGLGIRFDAPGTHGDEDSDTSFADVTSWVDTEQLATGRRVPMVLETGNFGFAFTVFVAVQVDRRNGTVDYPGLRLGRVRPRRGSTRVRDSSTLTALKHALFPGTRGGLRVSLLPPEGMLAATRVAGPLRRDEQLSELGVVPVLATAIADVAGRVWVFATDEEHDVRALAAEAEEPDRGHRLPVRAVALAAAAPDDRLLLFVVAPDGQLSVLEVRDGRAMGDPRPLGRRMTPGLATLTAESGTVAVLARRDDGQIVHRGVRPGDDQPDDAWDELGAAPDGELLAEWLDDGEGLLVRSVAPDGAEAVLYWPRYPERGAATEWLDVPAP